MLDRPFRRRLIAKEPVDQVKSIVPDIVNRIIHQDARLALGFEANRLAVQHAKIARGLLDILAGQLFDE